MTGKLSDKIEFEPIGIAVMTISTAALRLTTNLVIRWLKG